MDQVEHSKYPASVTSTNHPSTTVALHTVTDFPIRHDVFEVAGFTAPDPQDVEQVKKDDVLVKWGGATVAKIAPTIVVKYGARVKLIEAKSMMFASDNTKSIPIPRIFGYYRYGPIDRDVDDYESLFDTYIFMEFIEGQTLATAWDEYDESTKSLVVSQPEGYMRELRSISGGSYIGSVHQGPVLDQTLEQFERKGPFTSEEEFNLAIVDAYHAQAPKRHIKQFLKNMLACFRHRVVFTHNDFAPRNIMVQDGKVTGIIDWETSGWYPAHWEYSTALYTWKWQNDWTDFLGKVLQPYYPEYAIYTFLTETLW